MQISAKCRRTLGWSLTDWRDPKHVPTAAEGVLRKARNPHDSALRQVAFLGFPKQASTGARVATMDRFMKQHFPRMQVKHIDVSFNRGGTLASHGYVELGSKQHARLVTSATKQNGFTVPGFEKVGIKPENTDVSKNWNWALNKAKEIRKVDDRCFGKRIEKKRGKDRGIEVDGVPAFVQCERYAKGIEFVGDFAELRLP